MLFMLTQQLLMEGLKRIKLQHIILLDLMKIFYGMFNNQDLENKVKSHIHGLALQGLLHIRVTLSIFKF